MWEVLSRYKESYRWLSPKGKIIYNISLAVSAIILWGTFIDRYLTHPYYYDSHRNSTKSRPALPISHFQTEDYILGWVYLLWWLASKSWKKISSHISTDQMCEGEICKVVVGVCTQSRESLQKCSEVLIDVMQ